MKIKIRSDAKLSTVAKKLGVSEEIFRHPSGRKIRKDKRWKNMDNRFKK